MLAPSIKRNWMWSSKRWHWKYHRFEISELKCTGMGKFNSDDYYIHYYRQESLRRNGVALTINKRAPNAVIGCNLKNDRIDLSSFPRQTIQYHGNPTPVQCPKHWSWRSWSWPVLSRPTALSRTPSITNTPPQKKNVLFIIGDLKAKVGCQEIHRITGKFGLGVQNEAGQKLRRVLPREHTGHSKHSFPTTQATTQYMDITRWSIPKSEYYFCSQRWRSST